MSTELWKMIDGYSKIYYISNLGNIKNKKFSMKMCKNNGYYQIGLRKNGKQYILQIHRLVAEAFIPNPYNKPQVNHKNGIKSDNRVENLEWVTSSENIKHAYDTGLKFQTENNLFIKNNPSKGKFGKNNPVSIPIIQHSLDGAPMKEWECTRIAGISLGIKPCNICLCLKGKTNSSGGFIWKYK